LNASSGDEGCSGSNTIGAGVQLFGQSITVGAQLFGQSIAIGVQLFSLHQLGHWLEPNRVP
jgi:hypothetical protein